MRSSILIVFVALCNAAYCTAKGKIKKQVTDLETEFIPSALELQDKIKSPRTKRKGRGKRKDKDKSKSNKWVIHAKTVEQETQSMIRTGEQAIEEWMAAIKEKHAVYAEQKAGLADKHQAKITEFLDQERAAMLLADQKCQEPTTTAEECNAEKMAIRQKETAQLFAVEDKCDVMIDQLRKSHEAALIDLEMDGRAILFKLEQNLQYFHEKQTERRKGPVKGAYAKAINDTKALIDRVQHILDMELTAELVKENIITITDVCLEIEGTIDHPLSEGELSDFKSRYIAALELALGAIDDEMRVLYVTIVDQLTTKADVRRMLSKSRTLRMTTSNAYMCGCDDGSGGLQSDLVRHRDRGLLEAWNKNEALEAERVSQHDARKLELTDTTENLWKLFSRNLRTLISDMFDRVVFVDVYPSCDDLV